LLIFLSFVSVAMLRNTENELLSIRFLSIALALLSNRGLTLSSCANRLANEIGAIWDGVLDFPLPMEALTPLRAKAEQEGRGDFTRRSRLENQPTDRRRYASYL
jgi:hypothetical protein